MSAEGRAVRLVALLVALAVAASGCASKDPPTPAEGPSTTGYTGDAPRDSAAPTAPPQPQVGGSMALSSNGSLPWNLIQCQFAYATLPAKADQVRAELPEGFELLQPAGPVVLVGFEINECEEGSGLDGPVTPQTYVSFWVGVSPPDGLGESGAAHFVNFDVLVQDEPRRRLLESWGVPVHDGSIASTRLPDGSFVADYELEGVGAFQMVAGPGRPAPPGGGGSFDQWTAGFGPCGPAYWRVDYTVHEQVQSAGTVSIDPASRYAAWFDAPVVAGLVNHGRWDYVNGRIDPPQCA